MYSKLVIGNEGPLSPNKVLVQKIDLLIWKEKSSNWMFTLYVWNITHAFYRRTSLYDHNQTAIYKKALKDWNSKKHACARQYEYSGRAKLLMQMTKVEKLLLIEDINLMASKIFYKLNYIQPYPRKKILALRNQMWRNNDMKFWKYIKLEVHRQFHNKRRGNQMVILAEINVCSNMAAHNGCVPSHILLLCQAATEGVKVGHHGY